MLLRDRIIEAAVSLRLFEGLGPGPAAERRELEARLDEAILAAGSSPDSLQLDSLILDALAVDPARNWSPAELEETVLTVLRSTVRRRIRTLADRGEFGVEELRTA